jgi:hypothetical protein
MFHDAPFNIAHRYGTAIGSEGTRGFARGGTDSSGDLGKIVGLIELLIGFLPPTAVHHFIPVWNDVVQWATERVTVRNAAIHASRRLPPQFFV